MAAEFASTPGIQGLTRTHERDVAIAELAGRQYGVVGRGQLMGMGLGGNAIDDRIKAGRFHVLTPGVYAVGHRVLPREARWMAAVLARGDGAVLSHWSAAAHWGIRPNSREGVDVTVARRSRSHGWIRCHLATLPADEVTVHEGIPITTVPRTTLDLAGLTSADTAETMIREAEFRRLHDRLSLWDLIDRYPGHRGIARLRTALRRLEHAPPGRTRSPLEEVFVPFLRRHRLPMPRLNDWIVLGAKRFQVDCHWPDKRQILELDSWEAHGGRSAFREDRGRDRLLLVAGYTVTRLTWSQLRDEPEALAADLRQLLTRLEA